MNQIGLHLDHQLFIVAVDPFPFFRSVRRVGLTQKKTSVREQRIEALNCSRCDENIYVPEISKRSFRVEGASKNWSFNDRGRKITNASHQIVGFASQHQGEGRVDAMPSARNIAPDRKVRIV